LKGSGKERLTGRLNLDAKALDGKLAMKVNMSASQTDNQFSDNRAIGFAMNMRPTDPVYNADGTYFQIPGTFANFNPLATVENRINKQRLHDFLFNASAGYTILDGWCLTYQEHCVRKQLMVLSLRNQLRLIY